MPPACLIDAFSAYMDANLAWLSSAVVGLLSDTESTSQAQMWEALLTFLKSAFLWSSLGVHLSQLFNLIGWRRLSQSLELSQPSEAGDGPLVGYSQKRLRWRSLSYIPFAIAHAEVQ